MTTEHKITCTSDLEIFPTIYTDIFAFIQIISGNWVSDPTKIIIHYIKVTPCYKEICSIRNEKETLTNYNCQFSYISGVLATRGLVVFESFPIKLWAVLNWIRYYADIWKCHWDSHCALQWRHNERHGISNHQPHDCLLNCFFRHR